MKRISVPLLGVVILLTGLSSAGAPAFALGGCGPNYHRNAWAAAYGAVKIKVGACDIEAMSPPMLLMARGGVINAPLIWLTGTRHATRFSQHECVHGTFGDRSPNGNFSATLGVSGDADRDSVRAVPA
jgi:hypothetical protein